MGCQLGKKSREPVPSIGPVTSRKKYRTHHGRDTALELTEMAGKEVMRGDEQFLGGFRRRDVRRKAQCFFEVWIDRSWRILPASVINVRRHVQHLVVPVEQLHFFRLGLRAKQFQHRPVSE